MRLARWVGPAGIVVLLAAAITGCGGYSAAEHRVVPAQARSTLEAVLTSWQEGETLESWQQKAPPVVVQDMEWKSGAKLKSFEIVGTPEAVDANLHCQVRLTLESPGGREAERVVKYLVGTSPVLTVFRSID